MKYQYKLSICMMVKDEEKNLPRCLDSLKPLLDKSYVELIIIDTGSSDRTVEISEQYTKKVYFHQWNNDFSEMRNISISYAKGEWVYIIDADEEMADAFSLIQLLEKDELKKYNTIQFQMNDYPKSKQPEMYMTYNSCRVFRNQDNFKYWGAVHNQPDLQKPVYYSSIVLRHYGYQFDNKELMERKFKRTASILIQELEKEPDNIYYRYQLANSYYIHGDLKDSLEQIRLGYQELEKLPLEKRARYVYVYAEYARDSYINHQFLDCIEKCKEGIEQRFDYVDLYYYLSISYQAIHEVEHAIEAAEKYLDLLNRYDELKISKDASIVMYTLDRSSKYTAYTLLTDLYYKNGDYENSLKYAVHIRDNQARIQSIIDLHIKLRRYRELAEHYRLMSVDEEKTRELFVSVLEQFKEGLSNQERLELERHFSIGDDDYAIFNKIGIADGDLGKLLVKEFIVSTDFNNKDLFYSEVFKTIDRDHRDVFTAFKKIKSYVLKQIIKHLIDRYGAVEKYLLNYLQVEKIRPTDYQNARVYTCIANVLFLNETEKAKGEGRDIEKSYIALFEKYHQISLYRISQIYQMDKMKLYYSTIDQEEDQFFILLHFAEEAVQKGNARVGMKYMKEAVEAYPYLALATKELRENLLQEFDPWGRVNEIET